MHRVAVIQRLGYLLRFVNLFLRGLMDPQAEPDLAQKLVEWVGNWREANQDRHWQELVNISEQLKGKFPGLAPLWDRMAPGE